MINVLNGHVACSELLGWLTNVWRPSLDSALTRFRPLMWLVVLALRYAQMTLSLSLLIIIIINILMIHRNAHCSFYFIFIFIGYLTFLLKSRWWKLKYTGQTKPTLGIKALYPIQKAPHYIVWAIRGAIHFYPPLA